MSTLTNLQLFPKFEWGLLNQENKVLARKPTNATHEAQQEEIHLAAILPTVVNDTKYMHQRLAEASPF